MEKVDREMVEAVKKHGPISLPHSHIDEFYDRIDNKKKDIVANA